MTRPRASSRTSSNKKPRTVTRPDAADKRRRQMIEWMRSHLVPVQGSEIAAHFRVSRQCVVQDVAILRAGGTDILATPQGYRWPENAAHSVRAILACRHTPERTEEELQILVDHGVHILDVMVEHPLYGELRGPLMIQSRADLQDFIVKVKYTKAMLLLSLTGGIHLHTVEAPREEMISRARAKLRARGFLLK
jgi:transcriptional regulator of NAD metabolism